MFATIRRHQSWLLITIMTITIASFLYWGMDRPTRGGGGRSTKGPAINGKTVTPAMLGDALREVRLLYFLNFRKWPDQDRERAQQIGFEEENEAYLRLFRVGKAEEAGVRVADVTVAALAHRLLGDYPLEKFEKEVLIPNRLSALDFERFVRNDAAIQQLSTVVGAAGRLIPPTEAEALYRREHQELAGDIVFFHLTNYMSKVVITNGALTNFFSQQVARYRVPEKVRVSYVEFSKSNFLADADQRFATLTNLDLQIRDMYYKAGTNSFRDTNGNVLPEKEAIAKIKEDQRGRLALDFAHRKANDFANKLYDQTPVRAENLDKLAASEGLKVQVTPPFDMEEGPTNLNVSPKFASVAFSLAPNKPISFEPLEGENGIYIIALKESLPGRFQSFEEVQDKVTEDYKRFNSFTLARNDATNFVAKATNGIAQGKTFSEVAQQMKVPVETLPPISPSTESLTNLEERINVRQLKSILFSLEPGKASSFIGNPPDGGYIVYLREKLPFDDARLREELPKFIAKLRYEKQNEIFGQWFRKQIEQEAWLRDILAKKMKQRGAS
jgi:hypothetical protein